MYLTTNQSDKIQILYFGNTPFFSPHGTLFSSHETIFFVPRDRFLHPTGRIFHLPIEKPQKPTPLFLRKYPEEDNIPQYPGNDSTTQHTELGLVQQLRISAGKRQIGYEQRHRKTDTAQQ